VENRRRPPDGRPDLRQFQIPQQQKHPYPIVLVHGGGQTGSGWISNPDGRDGWATYFLRKGYAVYVVDQVGRGRSAYINDVYGPTSTHRANT